MFDFIKSRYEENRRDGERIAIVGPADEEIRIKPCQAGILLLEYVCFLGMIIYGSIHREDCPAENMVAISWIVIGSLGLLIKIITCVYDCRNVFGEKDVPKNTAVLCIYALLAIILVGWFFAMCYWSFKMEPDTKEEDHDKPNYCLSEFYRNAYWASIIGLTSLGVGFLCFCGCMIGAMCLES